jgi:phenylacetic acid degradation operon negative regulatory protein
LVHKARLPEKGPWDGKWRLFMFDIPEDYKEKRNILRKLLKANGFYKLQASVYINPHPLNREAIRFLKEKKLNQYIRILRVDEIDNDEDIKKRFNL